MQLTAAALFFAPLFADSLPPGATEAAVDSSPIIGVESVPSDTTSPSSDSDALEDLGEIPEAEEAAPTDAASRRELLRLRPDRIFSLPFPETLVPWELAVSITHRARQPLDVEPFDDLLGLDAGGLKVGIGARLGLPARFDLGVVRSGDTPEPWDTWQFDGRWQLFEPERSPWRLAIQAGWTLFRQIPSTTLGTDDYTDASGGFGALDAGCRAGRWEAFAGLAGHSSTTAWSSKPVDADEGGLGWRAGGDIRLWETLHASIEGSGGLLGWTADRPAFTAGLRWRTEGHSFGLFVTNTRAETVDAQIPGASSGDLLLGFSILRRFQLSPS